MTYQSIRDRHYIPNNGSVGQQIHYLCYLDGKPCGIISGGSAVFAVKCRDEFFGLTRENKLAGLNSIINNTVFRLEANLLNLGSQILAMWRRQVAEDWKRMYGTSVHGFETFIIGNERMFGALYKADNWTYVGDTSGSAKAHSGLGNPSMRAKTCVKMVFCKKIPHTKLSDKYVSTWRLTEKQKREMKYPDMTMDLFGGDWK